MAMHERMEFSCVITGGARGVDTIADFIAVELGISTEVYKADWKTYGPQAAGPIRNQQMIDQGHPDMAMAFPGGAGTADMARRCNKARIPLWKSELILFNSRIPKWEWLSNMAMGFEFVDTDGCVWASSEHYYQSRKVTDERLRGQIQSARGSFEAKRLGSQLKPIPDWFPPEGEDFGGLQEVAMREAIQYKYQNGSEAAKKLLATGENYLQEHSYWEEHSYWGVGGSSGLNRHGILLMEHRKMLKELDQ